MVTVLAVFGGGGGIVIVLTTVVVIGRGIFKQVNATQDLTEAVKDLTVKMSEMRRVLNGHETRIAVLEDRVKR